MIGARLAVGAGAIVVQVAYEFLAWRRDHRS
jgi:hypothetical protein